MFCYIITLHHSPQPQDIGDDDFETGTWHSAWFDFHAGNPRRCAACARGGGCSALHRTEHRDGQRGAGPIARHAFAGDRREPVCVRAPDHRPASARRLDAAQPDPAAGARRRAGFVWSIACARRSRRSAVPDQRHHHPGKHQRFRTDARCARRRTHAIAHRRPARAVRLSNGGRGRDHQQARARYRRRQHRHHGRILRHVQSGVLAVWQRGPLELFPDRQFPGKRYRHRESDVVAQRHPRSHRSDEGFRLRVVSAQRRCARELHVRHDEQPLPDSEQSGSGRRPLR